MVEQNKAYQNGDQRYLPRWEVNHKVLYKTSNDQFFRECMSNDISCCGACISAEKSIQSDNDVTLVIYLSDSVAVNVKGQVVWSSHDGGEYKLGLKFENVDPKTQELILNYAFNLDPKSLSHHWFRGWENP